ncbi:MAG: phosphopentomutase [Clostridia bacterium]|nr:phosphopentomutase [Clostridia bacterium]
MKRVFLIVLDSCGVGEMPDCADFGDENCNTLKRISHSPFFSAENLMKLGIGNIDGINYLAQTEKPFAAVARMTEKSRGKDTTIGHWEISGVVSEKPLPVYPDGFPQDILDEFSRRTGRGVICNKPYSGTDVIRDYGKQHVETGDLIVYTSADSVFQIAAHESVIPPVELYEYCRTAREILCGDNAVGRVIARPFEGNYPEFRRTANRHDFSLEPPKETLLDAVEKSGKSVYAVGKIYDIFAGKGISEYVFTSSNKDGMNKTLDAVEKNFEGLCFVNLVDYDMLYGHRQNIDGYAKAFAEFDEWLPLFIEKMRDDDVLMITADHGCDPGDSHTDHTREYTPLIVYGKNIRPVNLGTRESFADIAATVADYLETPFECDGKTFFESIIVR